MPAGHAWHVIDDVRPAPVIYMPGVQVTQAIRPVPEPYVPDEHGEHDELPKRELVPIEHKEQLVADVSLVPELYVPAVQAVQLETPKTLLKEPEPQDWHELAPVAELKTPA